MKMNQTEPVHAESAAPAVEPTQTEAKKPKKRWRILSSVFLFALIAGAMYFALRDTSLAEVWSAVQSANPLWLLCALGASLIAAVMFGIALSTENAFH